MEIRVDEVRVTAVKTYSVTYIMTYLQYTYLPK